MARRVSFTIGQFTMSWEGDDPRAQGSLSSSTALPPPGEEASSDGVAVAEAFAEYAAEPYYKEHGAAPPLDTRSLVGLIAWLQGVTARYGYQPTLDGDTLLVQQAMQPVIPTLEERDRIY